MPETRLLRIFISYASQDLASVRTLYQRLKSEPWIEPWFDKENLLPGQDWDLEIYKALRAADLILLCLSMKSVSKEGYVQKEIKRALDYADEKPDGTIYLIPLRLDDCETPVRLKKWQWVDYFTDGAYEYLLKSLQIRFNGVQPKAEAPKAVSTNISPTPAEDFDLYKFIQIPAMDEVPYTFWIGKYPVTNAQYARFLDALDFGSEEYWKGFLKFNEGCIPIGHWKDEGWRWLQKDTGGKRKEPYNWRDENIGISNPENPVVGITWHEANAYTFWLVKHWNELPESQANLEIRPRQARLPLESEWVAAAGGDKPEDRFPWDPQGKVTKHEKEIVRRANVSESGIGYTTPVNAYLRGASPLGVMDMAGNVWEWQMNYRNKNEGRLALRGGSWLLNSRYARLSEWLNSGPRYRNHDLGFRVVVLPK